MPFRRSHFRLWPICDMRDPSTVLSVHSVSSLCLRLSARQKADPVTLETCRYAGGRSPTGVTHQNQRRMSHAATTCGRRSK